MKLSELAGKEVINIYDGIRLGIVGETDLIVNQKTGEIESIVIPNNGIINSIWREDKYMVIPWPSVLKVGNDYIIVDISEKIFENEIAF